MREEAPRESHNFLMMQKHPATREIHRQARGRNVTETKALVGYGDSNRFGLADAVLLLPVADRGTDGVFRQN